MSLILLLVPVVSSRQHRRTMNTVMRCCDLQFDRKTSRKSPSKNATMMTMTQRPLQMEPQQLLLRHMKNHQVDPLHAVVTVKSRFEKQLRRRPNDGPNYSSHIRIPKNQALQRSRRKYPPKIRVMILKL